MSENHCSGQAGQKGKGLARWRDLIQNNFVGLLSFSKNPPWFDARGVAIGFFVGLGLPIGSHTMILGALVLLARFNFPVAFAITWIVNPFTAVPIYYAYYYLGCLLLGDSTSMGMEGFRELMAPVLKADNFVQALKLFVYMDFRILVRLEVAALAVAMVAAVVGYTATYCTLAKRRDMALPKSNHEGESSAISSTAGK